MAQVKVKEEQPELKVKEELELWEPAEVEHSLIQDIKQEPECKVMGEKLIIAVYARPELYDTTSYYYRDKNRGNLAWRQVSEEVGVTAAECKKKWKSLRDTYAKKKKEEEMKKKNGNVADNSPKWRFFAVLSFLDRFITPRYTNDNMSRIEDITEDLQSNAQGQECEEEPEPEEPLEPRIVECWTSPLNVATSGSQSPVAGSSTCAPPPPPPPPPPSISAPVPPARRKKALRRPRDPTSEVEKALLEALRRPRPPPPPPPREFTAIEHFLLSLAPSVERMPYLDQEFVKKKFQEIIIEHLQNLALE